MLQLIAASLLVALSLFDASCVSGAPNVCDVDESYCPQYKVDDARNYCGEDDVILARPDVCKTYPFGAEYAGAFYCEKNLVEAWCK